MLAEAAGPRGGGRLENPVLEGAVSLAQSELVEDFAGTHAVLRRGQQIEIRHGPLPGLVETLAAQHRALQRLHRDSLVTEAFANRGKKLEGPQLTLRDMCLLLSEKIRPALRPAPPQSPGQQARDAMHGRGRARGAPFKRRPFGRGCLRIGELARQTLGSRLQCGRHGAHRRQLR